MNAVVRARRGLFGCEKVGWPRILLGWSGRGAEGFWRGFVRKLRRVVGRMVVFCSKAWQGREPSGDAEADLSADILMYYQEGRFSDGSGSLPTWVGTLPLAKALSLLFRETYVKRGGYYKVTGENAWADVKMALGLPTTPTSNVDQLRRIYKDVLLGYERERKALEEGTGKQPPDPQELVGYTLRLRLIDQLGRGFLYRWGTVLWYDASDGEHEVLLDDERVVRCQLDDLETRIGVKEADFSGKQSCPPLVPRLETVQGEPIKLDPAAYDLNSHQILSQRKRTRNTVDPADSIGEYNRPLFDTHVYVGSWSEPGRRTKRKFLDLKERLTAGQGISSEVIKCACGLTKDVGSMIECSICHCWSHSYCVGVDDVDKPEMAKVDYRCFLCSSKDLKTDSLAYCVANAIRKVRQESKWDDIQARIRKSAKLPLKKKIARDRGECADESDATQSKKASSTPVDEGSVERDTEEENRFNTALRDHLIGRGINVETLEDEELDFYALFLGIRNNGGKFRELTDEVCAQIWLAMHGQEQELAKEKEIDANVMKEKLTHYYDTYLAGYISELAQKEKADNDNSEEKDGEKEDREREASPVVMMEAVVAVDGRGTEDIGVTEGEKAEETDEKAPEVDQRSAVEEGECSEEREESPMEVDNAVHVKEGDITTSGKVVESNAVSAEKRKSTGDESYEQTGEKGDTQVETGKEKGPIEGDKDGRPGPREITNDLSEKKKTPPRDETGDGELIEQEEGEVETAEDEVRDVKTADGGEREVRAAKDDKGEVKTTKNDEGEVQPAVDDEKGVKAADDDEGEVQPAVDDEGEVQLAEDDEKGVKAADDDEGEVKAAVDDESGVKAAEDDEGLVKAAEDDEGEVITVEDEKVGVKMAEDDEGGVKMAEDDEGEVKLAEDDEGEVKLAEDDEGEVKLAEDDDGEVQTAEDDEGEVRMTDDDEGEVRTGEEDEGEVLVPEAATVGKSETRTVSMEESRGVAFEPHSNPLDGRSRTYEKTEADRKLEHKPSVTDGREPIVHRRDDASEDERVPVEARREHDVEEGEVEVDDNCTDVYHRGSFVAPNNSLAVKTYREKEMEEDEKTNKPSQVSIDVYAGAESRRRKAGDKVETSADGLKTLPHSLEKNPEGLISVAPADMKRDIMAKVEADVSRSNKDKEGTAEGGTTGGKEEPVRDEMEIDVRPSAREDENRQGSESARNCASEDHSGEERDERKADGAAARRTAERGMLISTTLASVTGLLQSGPGDSAKVRVEIAERPPNAEEGDLAASTVEDRGKEPSSMDYEKPGEKENRRTSEDEKRLDKEEDVAADDMEIEKSTDDEGKDGEKMGVGTDSMEESGETASMEEGEAETIVVPKDTESERGVEIVHESVKDKTTDATAKKEAEASTVDQNTEAETDMVDCSQRKAKVSTTEKEEDEHGKMKESKKTSDGEMTDGEMRETAVPEGNAERPVLSDGKAKVAVPEERGTIENVKRFDEVKRTMAKEKDEDSKAMELSKEKQSTAGAEQDKEARKMEESEPRVIAEERLSKLRETKEEDDADKNKEGLEHAENKGGTLATQEGSAERALARSEEKSQAEVEEKSHSESGEKVPSGGVENARTECEIRAHAEHEDRNEGRAEEEVKAPIAKDSAEEKAEAQPPAPPAPQAEALEEGRSSEEVGEEGPAKEGASREGEKEGASCEDEREGASREDEREGASREDEREGALPEAEEKGKLPETEEEGALPEAEEEGALPEAEEEGALPEAEEEGALPEAVEEGALSEAEEEGALSEAEEEGALSEDEDEGELREADGRDALSETEEEGASKEARAEVSANRLSGRVKAGDTQDMDEDMVEGDKDEEETSVQKGGEAGEEMNRDGKEGQNDARVERDSKEANKDSEEIVAVEKTREVTDDTRGMTQERGKDRMEDESHAASALKELKTAPAEGEIDEKDTEGEVHEDEGWSDERVVEKCKGGVDAIVAKDSGERERERDMLLRSQDCKIDAAKEDEKRSGIDSAEEEKKRIDALMEEYEEEDDEAEGEKEDVDAMEIEREKKEEEIAEDVEEEEGDQGESEAPPAHTNNVGRLMEKEDTPNDLVVAKEDGSGDREEGHTRGGHKSVMDDAVVVEESTPRGNIEKEQADEETEDAASKTPVSKESNDGEYEKDYSAADFGTRDEVRGAQDESVGMVVDTRRKEADVESRLVPSPVRGGSEDDGNGTDKSPQAPQKSRDEVERLVSGGVESATNVQTSAQKQEAAQENESRDSAKSTRDRTPDAEVTEQTKSDGEEDESSTEENDEMNELIGDIEDYDDADMEDDS